MKNLMDFLSQLPASNTWHMSIVSRLVKPFFIPILCLTPLLHIHFLQFQSDPPHEWYCTCPVVCNTRNKFRACKHWRASSWTRVAILGRGRLKKLLLPMWYFSRGVFFLLELERRLKPDSRSHKWFHGSRFAWVPQMPNPPPSFHALIRVLDSTLPDGSS